MTSLAGRNPAPYRDARLRPLSIQKFDVKTDRYYEHDPRNPGDPITYPWMTPVPGMARGAGVSSVVDLPADAGRYTRQWGLPRGAQVPSSQHYNMPHLNLPESKFRTHTRPEQPAHIEPQRSPALRYGYYYNTRRAREINVDPRPHTAPAPIPPPPRVDIDSMRFVSPKQGTRYNNF